MDGPEGKWFPPFSVKSGKVLVSADFLNDLGGNDRDILQSLLAGGDSKGPYGPSGQKNSYVPSNKSGQNARDDPADASGALKSLKSESPKSVDGETSEDDNLSDKIPWTWISQISMKHWSMGIRNA